MSEAGEKILRGLNEALSMERAVTAAVVALAEANIPTGVQELLLHGDARMGVAPCSIHKAIASALKAIAHGEPHD